MARASNFTDQARAEIFVRDRAHCCYDARPLWILDEGAAWRTVDWADHMEPVSAGGLSVASNGRAACYECNREKGTDQWDGPVLREGRKAEAWVRLTPEVQRLVRSNLGRFAKLDVSDWYFNRALFHVLLGVDWKANGKRYKRGDTYRASAAFKYLKRWRALSESVLSLEERGLASMRPATHQRLLLDIREAHSSSVLIKLMDQLVPAYREYQHLVESADRVLEDEGEAAFRQFVSKHKAKLSSPGMAFWREETLTGVLTFAPDAILAEILGVRTGQRIPGVLIVRGVWAYIKEYELQDKKNPETINADAKLVKLFGDRRRVGILRLHEFVNLHLSP